MNIRNENRPIVVGIDGDEYAATHYALNLAQQHGCGVRVVHAYRLPVSAVPGMMIDQLAIDQDKAAAQELLDMSHVQVDAEDIDVPVEYSLTYAAPTEALIEEAKSARALVLGADDVAWFDRLFVGQVSSWVSTRAACPVIVVPVSWTGPDPRGGNVVVTLEGTTSAHGPLAFAFAHADRTGQTLHVLHVSPPGTVPADNDEQRVNLAEILAGWSEQFPGVEVFTTITNGQVDKSILRHSSLASMVVVGRPDRHDFPFSLSRPTATAVIKRALCPVAVVPSDFEA